MKLNLFLGLCLGLSAMALMAEPKADLHTRLETLGYLDNCPNNQICLRFLQINDVYEIGSVRGLARLERLASLRSKLTDSDVPLLTVISGDFYSPSALGTLRDDQGSWSGKQMVSILKEVGVNLAVIGNHEFDIKAVDFQKRLDESASPKAFDTCSKDKPPVTECLPSLIDDSFESTGCFDYVATNVSSSEQLAFKASGKPLARSRILEIKRGAQSVRMGILGLSIQQEKGDFQKTSDILESADSQITELKSQKDVDTIIALTHTNIDEDLALLKAQPTISLIMGGHEHKNHYQCEAGRCIAKADANAITAYIHELRWDAQSGNLLNIDSDLIAIDESIPSDPELAERVNCWFQKADFLVKVEGAKSLSLSSVIADTGSSTFLDASDESQRRPQGSSFTKFYMKASLDLNNRKLEKLRKETFDVALTSAGGFRVDDYLGPGKLRVYDVLRTLPYGGDYIGAEISVSSLAALLKRTWADLPLGSGAISHMHPKLAASDLNASEIDLKTIEYELISLFPDKLKDSNSKLRVIVPEYSVKFGFDFTEEEKASFTILEDETLPVASMQEVLVIALEESFPLKK